MEDSMSPQQIYLTSFHGLGNSIINLPIYYLLKTKFKVTMLGYNSTSTPLFKALNIPFVNFSNLQELLFFSIKNRSELTFISWPNWKKDHLYRLFNTNENSIHYLKRFSMGGKGSNLKFQSNKIVHDLDINFSFVHKLCLEPKLLDFLMAEIVIEPSEKRILSIHPTASSKYKFYPVNFWSKLLADIHFNFDEVNIFCGSSDVESIYCKEVILNFHSKELSSKTILNKGIPLIEVFQKIKQSSQFIGLDSALMHFAALNNVNTLGLWSFADFRRIYPYGNFAKIYLPNEVFEQPTNKYPNQELSWLKRSDPKFIARALVDEETESFGIDSDFSSATKVFLY